MGNTADCGEREIRKEGETESGNTAVVRHYCSHIILLGTVKATEILGVCTIE